MKHQKPGKPPGMNGDIAHLWDKIDSVESRVDGLYTLILAGVAAGLAAIGIVGGLIIALD